MGVGLSQEEVNLMGATSLAEASYVGLGPAAAAALCLSQGSASFPAALPRYMPARAAY